MGQFGSGHPPLSMKMLVVLALVACVAAEPEAKAKADPYYYGGYYGGLGSYGGGYRSYGLGYGGYAAGLGYYGKREADAEPKSEAEPKADADPYYYGGYGGYGYGRSYGGYGGYGLGYRILGYYGSPSWWCPRLCALQVGSSRPCRQPSQRSGQLLCSARSPGSMPHSGQSSTSPLFPVGRSSKLIQR